MNNNIFNLKKKVSLITGGNGGIGLGMAKGLASSGSNIAIIGRNSKKNLKAKEELKQFNVKIETYAIDVSSENDVKKTVNKIVNDHNGKIEFIPRDNGAKIKINFIK